MRHRAEFRLQWDLYHAMRSPNAKDVDKIKRAPGMEKRRKSA